ncbi:hypothetical protein HWV62_12562 [Athelia sp. TMB]|nr:hypothetical protein HWV62_12562 [Athelia sp. TMB]
MVPSSLQDGMSDNNSIPIDWTLFEPNSVKLSERPGKDWIWGRAMWRSSTLMQSGLAIYQLHTLSSMASDHFIKVSLEPPATKSYFVPSERVITPDISFSKVSRPLNPSIFPLPNLDDSPQEVGFCVARASDVEGQARLRLEIQGSTVQYYAGISVLPRSAYWKDRFGNLVCITHSPSHDSSTFREMYLSPRSTPTATTPNAVQASSDPHRGPKGASSFKGLGLDHFLEHAIKMVAVMELDGDDSTRSTSFARNLASDHYDTEKWIVMTHAQYLAPEILREAGATIDARADIFSIGSILYEVATGRPPALGADFLSTVYQVLAVEPQAAEDLAPGIPNELSRIISKCLEKAPQNRYTSARSLRYDLELLAQALKSDPQPEPLLDVGAMDHYSSFRLAGDLIGMEESLRAMKVALGDAKRNGLVAVSITGASGTGKTSLASSIRQEVTAAGGKFCVGKYDSTSYNLPLTPAWQIVNQLALSLLALPEKELDSWRFRIREAIGPALVQFFEVYLDPELRTSLHLVPSRQAQEEAVQEDTGLPPAYKNAFYGAIRRFLALFVAKVGGEVVPCTHRPLVLFFDDVQWSSADDISFFCRLLATERLLGCMLIFAFRDNEGSDAFLQSDLRETLCGLAYHLQTKLLERQDIYIMLRTMFQNQDLLDQDESIRSLSTFLHAQSLGNAQTCRLLLRNLYQNQMLSFDWNTCQWTWDIARINKLSSTDSALEFWESLLAGRSTTDMRKIVFSAAAISTGGSFSVQTLAHVTQQPLENVTKLIETFARETRVFTCVSVHHLGLTSPPTLPKIISTARVTDPPLPLSVLPTLLDSDQWMFTHDQLQQAAKILLPASQRAIVHAQIGAALRTFPTRNESGLQCLVYNLNESRILGLRASREDDLSLIQLNIQAAKANLRSAAGPAALRHLEHANKLIGDDRRAIWKWDYQTGFELAATFIECYTLTAQYNEALEIADTVQEECISELDILIMAGWKLKALVNLDTNRALDFGLQQLSELCKIKVGAGSIDVVRSRASFGDATAEQIFKLIPLRPRPEVAARAAILNSLITLSFSSAPDIAEEIVLYAVIASRDGFTQYTPFAFSVFVFFKHSQGMHQEAKELSRAARSYLHKIESPYSRLETEMGLACTLHFSAKSLRDVAGLQLQIANDGESDLASENIAELVNIAADLAHYEFLNFAIGYGYLTQLMGGANTVPPVGESWLKTLESSIPPSFLNFVVVPDMTSAFLKGLTVLPPEAPLIRPPVPLELSSENILIQVQATCCEAMLSFIFDRLDPSLLDRLILYKNKTPGNLHYLFWFFYEAKLIYGLAALGILPEPAIHLETADRAIEKMHHFANSAANYPIFVLPYRMIEAARLEHIESYPEALALLEVAINEAVTNGPTLLLAMAYEQAGKLVLKWTRSDFLSGSFLIGAHQTFKELGAAAKCAQMESMYNVLNGAVGNIPASLSISSSAGGVLPASGPESSNSGSGSGSSSADSVDLATLLSAVSTWQRENSASRVAASLVSILMKSMGARYGALALMGKDGILRLSVAGPLDDLRSDLHVAIEQCGDIAPTSLINYAMRTHKTILDLVSVSAHVGLRDDPFFASHRPRSIFVLPIVEERSLRGVCYMDSSREQAFSKASLELVGLLTTGAAVAIERVHLLNELDAQTKSLEHTVRVRTAAAEAAAAKAEQASQAQARFLQTMSHEMRTPLNSVVVLSDLLLEAQLDPVLYDYVSTIKASSNDLLAVIRDVLDFSRLESNNIVLEELPFDLVELVDGTLEQISQVAVAKNIVTFLFFGFLRLRLTLNRFTGENGSVTVTISTENLALVDEPGLRVCIDVADTGMGIPAPKIPLLFKKFSQLDNSTTRLFGGSGLGLVIVHELARLMKGDAWCESDFGKGSIFHFTFEAGIAPPPLSPYGQREPLDANAFEGKVASVIGLGPETYKTVVKNLTWLGFDVLHGEAGTNFNGLLASTLDRLDLVVILSDGAVRSTEAMVEALTAIHPRVRLIFLSKQRQTAAQVERAEKLQHRAEYLSTPLKVRHLATALRRLFPPVTPPVYVRTSSARKPPQKIPRLREMPRLDGTSAMRIIREEHPSPQGPAVVALTASAMSGDKELALQNGFHL